MHLELSVEIVESNRVEQKCRLLSRACMVLRKEKLIIIKRWRRVSRGIILLAKFWMRMSLLSLVAIVKVRQINEVNERKGLLKC